MQSVTLVMHDDLLQSSNTTRVTDSVVMPAVTVQVPTFSLPLMHDSTLESDDPQKDGMNTQSPMHAQYVLQLLQLQRQAGFLCDITIHVKDRSFKAHKPLLAACSLYFRSLFSDPNTKESTALNLVPIPPAGFEVLLDYIYTGNLAITAENCSAVLSAATCLQMTNVVETCKKFMQSTFQMSSCKESGLVDSNKEKFLANYGSYFKSNKVSKHQEEYPSALSCNASDTRSLLQNRSVNVEALQRLASSSSSSIPSASQLQSVLPLLMSNQPRQPTPHEVQNILASIPNAAELLAKYPVFSSAIKNLSLNPIISTQKLADEYNVTTSSVYLPAKLSTSNHSLQNGHFSKLSPNPSRRNSAQDQTTRCAAALNARQAAAEQGLKTDQSSPQKERAVEDASNSIEISSDDESENGAWSTDRSVRLSSDLSGTPCTVAARVQSATRDQLLSVENNRDFASVQKKPVVKTLSLPILSVNPPAKPLPRAHSTEESDPLNGSPDGNSRGSFPDRRRHMKESVIIDEVSPVEYARRRGYEMSGRMSGLEQASDTLSPMNGRFGGSDLSPNSADGSMDDNIALDLSVPNALDLNKRLKAADSSMGLGIFSKRSESECHPRSSSRRSSAASSLSDPGMQMAIDALEMLKQSKAKEVGMMADRQTASVSSDSNSDLPDSHKEGTGWDDDNLGILSVGSVGATAKQATYSRKPRRTTDGQMCSWPGCKQVFRHRNMYEEHMKMHRRGAPAAQLRKCYMGARVKKTVREQLEELRSDVFEGEPEGSRINRTRKRKSNPDVQEPLRKRVNVKDRVGHFQFSPANQTRPSMSRKPLHQVIHSLSKSPTSQDSPPAFIRPPALIPSYAANPMLLQDMRSEGMLRLPQGGNDPATSPVKSQPPALTLGSPYSLAPNAQRSPTDAAYGRIALSSAQMQGVSPIKATLALLGIQTPMRSTDLAISSQAIGGTSPVEHFRRRPSANDAAVAKPIAESLFQSTAVGTSLAPCSGESSTSGGAAEGDFMGKDAPRMMSDASSASSGSPPAWANNTNPSIQLNR